MSLIVRFIFFYMLKDYTNSIQNSRVIFYNSFLNELPFLDKQISSEFRSSMSDPTNKKTVIIGERILKMLNIYLFLTGQKLSYMQFKNNKNEFLFSDFLRFLNSDFIKQSIKTKQQYKNIFLRTISVLNESRVEKIELNEEFLGIDYDLSRHLDIKVLNGICLESNQTILFSSLKYSVCFGRDETYKIYDLVNIFKNHPKVNNATFAVLNSFLDYLCDIKKSLFSVSDNELSDFISIYFNNLSDNKINISPYKANWNNFINYIKDVFSLSINEKFLRLKTQRIIGNQTNIKAKSNSSVKTKLMTDVPLEICDEKSIFLLKNQINQNIEIIEHWAKEVVEDYKLQKNIGLYPYDEFFIEDPVVLRTKYKMWKNGKGSEWYEDNFNLNAIFNKKHMFAICSLLIINHPQITESFLYELTTKSIIKNDNSVMLVGKKHRKGKEYAEQKIMLNDYTFSLINLLIENNKIMSKVINTNSLFLHTNSTARFRILAPEPHSFSKTKEITDSLSDFIINKYNFNEFELEHFLKKTTFSKIRSTCAIKSFFKYESTRKMAEILGHESYNSSLLTHYLPEPIIHFYQSRWIRIFQKGIIYEAMKDSHFVLDAIGFENMDILNEFLSNHVLKNLPSNKIITSESVQEFDDCYISINETNLTALLSLKDAVDNSKQKEKITGKAIFWSDFAEKLISEINNNKIYYSLQPILEKALEKLNKQNYEKVIYA